MRKVLFFSLVLSVSSLLSLMLPHFHLRAYIHKFLLNSFQIVLFPPSFSIHPSSPSLSNVTLCCSLSPSLRVALGNHNFLKKKNSQSRSPRNSSFFSSRDEKQQVSSDNFSVEIASISFRVVIVQIFFDFIEKILFESLVYSAAYTPRRGSNSPTMEHNENYDRNTNKRITKTFLFILFLNIHFRL